MFIANRGEIAARIRRTTDRLGIRAIAPGTEGVVEVDLLDIGAVVAAAMAAGADALHPGFGFLSENAAFAEAVEAAGIRWVGPPPSAIRAMGDKAAARHRAAALGIPVVPGYDADDQSDDALLAAAREIAAGPRRARHAVLIKPAAGGGGKGMRVVRDLAEPTEFLGALAAARREAALAFGDPRLILERYLAGPRHVEVQVLFDAAGQGVHLGERDCSLQRRHQKVLEESPSPAVDDGLRERLGEAALKLAGSVGYRSAGTCEFLLDDDGSFHFLEMNTRLQVEHPVTELITGRDLVADQLRIAAGEPLGFSQADADRPARQAATRSRSACTPRIPTQASCPRPAGSRHWPGRQPPVRVDSGIEPGSVVDTRFDPMLAKVIVGGRNRAEALTNMSCRPRRDVRPGAVTNLHFLRWLVRQPVVRRGRGADRHPRGDLAARRRRGRDGRPRPRANAGCLAGRGPRAGGRLRRRLAPERSGPDPAHERGPGALGRARPGGHWGSGTGQRGRRRRNVRSSTTTAGASPSRSPHPPMSIGRPGPPLAMAPPAAPEVDAPMPGSVLAIHAGPGSVVEAGQPLLTLEAMKMEHVVVAPVAGVVAEVLVEPGEQVVRGRSLLTLAPLPGPIAAEPLP